MAIESLLREYGKRFAIGALIVSAVLMVYVIYEIETTKKQFADQLTSRSIAQTESDLDNFFNRISNLVHSTAFQYRSGFWEDQAEKNIILHAISLIENYEPVSSIGIADLRGREENILPAVNGDEWLHRKVFADRWGEEARWSRWRIEDENEIERVHSWRDSLPIDPRNRPWYRGAVAADGQIYWTEPYEYTTGPEVGITASKLLSHEADSLARILAFDLTLNDLNEFIDDLSLTDNQEVFLLDGGNNRVIALHNFTETINLQHLDISLRLTPMEAGSKPLVRVLAESDNDGNAFRFFVDGNAWWGISQPYSISDHQHLTIVSVLPEKDFASGANRTLMTGGGAFLIILLLSFLVLRNHNRLHRVNKILLEKNSVISEQKKVLFSEVHHRVKNNLAIISAFLELDLMKMKDAHNRWPLRRNMRRIKAIALIQEEVYRSEKLGVVSLEAIIDSLAQNFQQTNAGCKLVLKTEPVEININQGMSFGLLINELCSFMTDHMVGKVSQVAPLRIRLNMSLNEQTVTMILQPEGNSVDEHVFGEMVEEDVIRALSRQLDSDVEIETKPELQCRFRFKLKEKKGVVGSRLYRSTGEQE